MSRQTDKQERKEEEKMDNSEYSLKFTKRELTFIFNVLATRADYRAGDGFIAFNILQRIQPIVATASHDVPEEEEANKEVKVNLGEKN